jgi:5,5'-dehydrodivanillate O-demethylase
MERLGRPELVRTTASTEFSKLPEKGVGPFGWGNVIFPYTDVQHDTYQIRVPVDDTHTLHLWYTYYDVEDEQFAHIAVPPQPDSVSIPWFEVPMAGLTDQGEPTWPLLDNNSGQDLTMWYTQGPIVDRSQEHLGNGDRNIIQMRQYVEEQIRLVEAGEDPVNVFRDPAANVCLTPSYGFKRSNRRADGQIDLTTAARKYSPLLQAAVAAEQGAAALADPVS